MLELKKLLEKYLMLIFLDKSATIFLERYTFFRGFKFNTISRIDSDLFFNLDMISRHVFIERNDFATDLPNPVIKYDLFSKKVINFNFINCYI